MVTAIDENPVRSLQDRIRENLSHRRNTSTGRFSLGAFSSARQGERIAKISFANRLSRAACLHLINQLARYAPYGVLVVMMITGWIGVTHIATMPFAVTIWLAMVGLSGAKLMIRNRSYLAGDAHIASRPFHWRACHTSNMAVFGAAFGSGMIVLIPESALLQDASSLMILILCAAGIAAATQIAHGRACLAMVMPVLICSAWTAFRIDLPASMITFASALIIAFSTLLALGTIMLVRRAHKRYPRTVYEPMKQNMPRLSFRRKVLPSVAPQRQRMVG